MNTKRKPIVGETLYMLNVGNAARRSTQVLKPCVVDRVGRKYFTTLGGFYDSSITEFNLEGWYERTEYTANYRLYESPQEWEQEKESGELERRIKKTFDSYSRVNIPLQDLREINAILDRSKKQETQP